MRFQNIIAKSLTIISIIVGVLFAVSANADTQIENDIISELAHSSSFAPVVISKDPFKPMIVKKVIRPIVRPVKLDPKPVKPVVKKIKPLRVKVTGVCGNDSLRQALVQYKGKEYTVSQGQTVQGKFKVIDINPDRVVVYSIKEKRRHTFALGKISR